MPWESRGNQRYFYRSIRLNGRVRTLFLGAGPVAELAAAMDLLAQVEEAERLLLEEGLEAGSDGLGEAIRALAGPNGAEDSPTRA
ncbi:MAG: hypothetical protein K2W96_23875 [Gemmataceae bacterium]|nr:hypothetical protein [Gemmataceae bacterium]